jgi:hypothetical protein
VFEVGACAAIAVNEELFRGPLARPENDQISLQDIEMSRYFRSEAISSFYDFYFPRLIFSLLS